MHIHDNEEEYFIVVEGTLRITVGEKTLEEGSTQEVVGRAW